MITGSASDVEQLTPKLTQELWQEDQGTLLLWGGDPAAPADADWLTALRKLRHRPADGMVWVTSAFDRLAGSDAEPAAPLTPESIDALAHALKGAMTRWAGNCRCMSGRCIREPESSRADYPAGGVPAVSGLQT